MKVKYLVALTLFVSMTATAQLGGLSGVLGSNNSDSNAESAMSAESSQAALVATFIETLSLVMTAQQRLQNALGNSEEAQILQLSIDELSGECAKECMERTVEISATASESIKEKMESQELLEADKKEMYVAALPPYIQGTLKAKDLANEAASWSTQSLTDLKDAGVMGARSLRAKLEVGTFVAGSLPALIKNWGESTTLVLNFAKSNDIDLDSIEGVNDFDFN